MTRSKCGRKGMYLLEEISHEKPSFESRPVNPNYGISGLISSSNYSVQQILSNIQNTFLKLGVNSNCTYIKIVLMGTN